MTLKFATVSSGIEGPSWAWKVMAWESRFFSEIDPYACAFLEYHFSETPNLGDMTAPRFWFEMLTGPREGRARHYTFRRDVDVLIAGTPCQGFSIAGLRKSLSDPRSRLVLDYLDVADALDPPVIVWENVPGILNTHDNAFGVILARLVGADGPLDPPSGCRWTRAGVVDGPRRTAAWRILDSQYFGVAQRRERLILVACPGNGPHPATILFESDGRRRDHPPVRGQETDATGDATQSPGDGGCGPVPLNALPSGVARALSSSHTGAGRQHATVETWVGQTIAHPLTREGPGAREDGSGRGSASVPVAAVSGASCPVHTDGDLFFPLTARDGDQSAVVLTPPITDALDATKPPRVAMGPVVRRLTPLEMERLQAIPDGATRIPFGPAWIKRGETEEMTAYLSRHVGRPLNTIEAQSLAADSPIARALGNTMTVTLLQWLGRRIESALTIHREQVSPAHVMAPTRPAARYFGGKWKLAPWIIKNFPPHVVYVEPFCGAASVLLRKPRSRSEIINDLDGEIVGLFRILRDPEQAARLREALRLTPFARTELQDAFGPLADDPLEQARRFLVRSMLGFHPKSANGRNTGFRTMRQGTQHPPSKEWGSYPDAIPAITDRLQGVMVENREALEIIRAFDGSDTLFYLDPPYPHGTRVTGSGYRQEMSDEDHRNMASVVRALKGMVVISGYACALYDEELYPDWQRISTNASAQGQRGATSRTECLWINPSAWTRRSGQLCLFRDTV